MLKLDLINNVDHMLITGTESSSVILSQTEYCYKCDGKITQIRLLLRQIHYFKNNIEFTI